MMKCLFMRRIILYPVNYSLYLLFLFIYLFLNSHVQQKAQLLDMTVS